MSTLKKKATLVCKGEVNLELHQQDNTVTARFTNIDATNPETCKTCPYNTLCSRITTEAHIKTIMVKAFTGMPIAELPIFKETPTYIEVVTKKGTHLKFDKKSGLQMNAKDTRYANKITI